MEAETQEYLDFVEKFKPQKTTDDCYTPENVYNVVADWAAKKYGFDSSQVVRPFWPGGDFERFEYPEWCVVLDNPPFSILAKIRRFYNRRGIKYFLFAPSLTLFNMKYECNYIVAACNVTYANGAVVNTSFVTNMGEYLIETAPELTQAVKAANDENSTVKELPKYEYPSCVAHAARLNYLSVHGVHFKVAKNDALPISKLDEQGKDGIFGGGFLLSERAAAERAAAENVNRRVWKLSERELKIQRFITTRRFE